MPGQFQPTEIFRILAEHRVEYVVIGALAATLHGSNLRTGDTDICPSQTRENLVRLAAAMSEMEALIRTPDAPSGLPFACEAELLERVDILEQGRRSSSAPGRRRGRRPTTIFSPAPGSWRATSTAAAASRRPRPPSSRLESAERARILTELGTTLGAGGEVGETDLGAGAGVDADSFSELAPV